jgi:hypothetical protein
MCTVPTLTYVDTPVREMVFAGSMFLIKFPYALVILSYINKKILHT